MNPAIRPREHVIRVRRINPQPVIVTVDSSDDVLNPCLAAVLGGKHVSGALPDALVVVRIDPNLAVIHRPRIQIAHLLPRCAAVLGPEHPSLCVLDEGVDDAWVAAANVQAYSSGDSFGEVFGEFGPRSPAVNRFIDSAAGPAAVEAPRGAASLISSPIKRPGTLGVHRNIDYPGVFVDEQRLRPGLAGIGRLVDSSLAVRSPKMAERRDVDGARIMRVDDDAADVPGIFQTHVLPGLTAVQRAINAVAPGRTLAIVWLAGSDPDDVGIGRRYADVADRGRSLFIKDRLEGRAGVSSFPHAAGCRSNVESGSVAFNDREVVNASAHDSGTDVAPMQIFQGRFFRPQLAVLSVHDSGRCENGRRDENQQAEAYCLARRVQANLDNVHSVLSVLHW